MNLHFKNNSFDRDCSLAEIISFLHFLSYGTIFAYVQQRGRTGGWMDAWCPHNTKVGAKLETMQESVSDISDIIHCLEKMPKLHILDDPCHYVR